MRDGFISVACGTPKLRLADCRYNAEQTFAMMRAAEKAGVKVLVLPELGLTGYTCGDLFCVEEEFVDGIRLSELLETSRPDDAQACAIIRQVCRWASSHPRWK